MTISGIAVGDAGGIAVGVESTYGTASAQQVWQHAKSAGIALRKTLRPPMQLTTTKPTNRQYGLTYGEGPIVMAYTDERDIIGPIMGALGSLSTDDYTIGGGDTPEYNSLTIWVDTGGHTMRYVGCKPTRVRWDFTADAEIVMTVDFLAQNGTKITALTVDAPDEQYIVMASALTPATLGTNGICVLGGFIQVDIPHEGGTERQCLGSSLIKEPQRRWLNHCTAGLNVELADESGNDTETELQHYIDGDAAGDLVLGDFTMEDCWLTGDIPALQAGLTSFPINLEGKQVVVTTQDTLS